MSHMECEDRAWILAELAILPLHAMVFENMKISFEKYLKFWSNFVDLGFSSEIAMLPTIGTEKHLRPKLWDFCSTDKGKNGVPSALNPHLWNRP